MKDKVVKLLSINELKELEYSSSELTPQQRLAIKNFDRYRFKVLTSIKSEEVFHKEFQRLQVFSNLSNYEDFLKDEYL